MSAVWDWIRNHWKWLLFPVWIISLLLVWIFRGGEVPFLPISGTTDEASDEALKAKDEAIGKFRARLDEIAEKAEGRLREASEDQIKEFDAVKDKPIDEVASWIDKLS